MTRFCLPILFFIFSSLQASESLPSFKNLQQFENFHTSLISILIEKEKAEQFPGKLLTPKEYKSLQSSVWQLFIKKAYASKKGDLCFFGGWTSYRVKGICRPPWRFAHEESLETFGPRYSKDNYCGAKTLFRCNPVIFGPGVTGKGTCVTISSYKNVTQACHDHLRNSPKDLHRLYQKFNNDEQFRENYLKLSQEAIKFCEDNPKYDACEFLKNTVHDFYKKTCQAVDTKVDVKAVTTAQSQVDKVLEHIVPAKQERLGTPAAIDPEKLQKAKDVLTPQLIEQRNQIEQQDKQLQHITYTPPSTHSDVRQVSLTTTETPQVTLREEINEQQVDLVEKQAIEQEQELAQKQREERMQEVAGVVLRFSEQEKREKRMREVAEVVTRSARQQKAYTPTARPAFSRSVNTQLPNPQTQQQRRDYGYYIYGPYWKKWGRRRTIWHIQEAGKKMSSQNGIIMGVGNISKQGGGRLKPHHTHRYGLDIDLRLIDKNKNAYLGIYSDSRFSLQNTYEMLAAFISIDPRNVKSIIINHATLRSMIKVQYPNIRVYPYKGHHNHIHLSLHR